MKDPTWDVVDLKFDERGLLVVDHASKVQFDDPITEEQKKLYEVELETLLKKELPHVSEIIFFDHNLRNSKKSVSCRTNPATHVHCDFSYETGVSEARKILGDKADDWFSDDGHVGIVNVWRPVGCTVEKNPLGLMDVKSLREEDKVQVRLLYGEDCPVGFNGAPTEEMKGEKNFGIGLKARKEGEHTWFAVQNVRIIDNHGEIIYQVVLDDSGAGLDILSAGHQDQGQCSSLSCGCGGNSCGGKTQGQCGDKMSHQIQ